jgi:hypothetical protein
MLTTLCRGDALRALDNGTIPDVPSNPDAMLGEPSYGQSLADARALLARAYPDALVLVEVYPEPQPPMPLLSVWADRAAVLDGDPWHVYIAADVEPCGDCGRAVVYSEINECWRAVETDHDCFLVAGNGGTAPASDA